MTLGDGGLETEVEPIARDRAGIPGGLPSADELNCSYSSR
jgi:hypothetical protein